MKKIIFFFICYVHVINIQATDLVNSFNSASQSANDILLLTKDPKAGVIVDTSLVTAGIAIWGSTQWNWGTESFHFHDEGWFEQDSKTGGSDKTGHFYMTYLLSRVIASRMQDRGLGLEESSLIGSLSGMTAMTLLEIGDASSPYGFSKEDFIADAVGAMAAYFIRANPKVDSFVDVRFEYWPSNNTEGRTDLTTDYSSMRHLVAFKLHGFDELKKTPLSLLELQVGYYSKGYRSYDTVKESQQVYVGIGISLADIARRSEINVLKHIFEFYQPGHTYVETNLWSRQ